MGRNAASTACPGRPATTAVWIWSPSSVCTPYPPGPRVSPDDIAQVASQTSEVVEKDR